MHAVVRRYKDTKLMETLVQRQDEVERVIMGAPGFVAYYLIKSADGGATVTVCEHQAGTSASSQRAGEWILQNAPASAGNAPEVTEGEVSIEFGRSRQAFGAVAPSRSQLPL